MAHTPGRFVWRERITPDAGIAQEFYEAFLGWTWEEVRSIDGPYFIAHVENRPVGGLWQPPPGLSLPVAWSSYLSVLDVDATTAEAQKLGWSVFRPPTDIPGIGRFSVLGDFARLGVLPYRNVGDDPRAGAVANGHFCWETLVTPDVARALQEYGELFGWKVQRSPNGEVPIFAVDDRRTGQIADVQQATPGNPARWLTYVQVADAALCSSRVEKLGGKVLVPRVDIPEVGTISFIADPGGAALGLYQPI